MSKAIPTQLMLFLAVGGVGTAAHYLVLVTLVGINLCGPVLATTAGFLCGMIINYVLNYRLTFASSKPHRLTAPRFATIAGVGMAFNAAIVYAMTEWTAVHYLLAQVCATAIVVGWGFLANHSWTFAQPARPGGADGSD